VSVSLKVAGTGLVQQAAMLLRMRNKRRRYIACVAFESLLVPTTKQGRN
jgi:hypothetical protein